MAIKTRIKQKTGNGYEVLHPETVSEQVIVDQDTGSSLKEVLIPATTDNPGLVELTDSVTSTSVTTAATPNSVKTAYELAKRADDALESKAPLASPALTGTPTAPTAAAGTSTAQLATTAFVGDANSALKKYFTDKGYGESTPQLDDVDLDTLTSSNGLYYIVNGINRPASINGYLSIEKYDDGTVFAKQTYTVVSTGEIYVRVKNAGSWTAWKRLETADNVGLKAPLHSPALTGTPTAPTPEDDSNGTDIATTAFVVSKIATNTIDVRKYTDDKIAAVISSSAATIEMLNQLSEALGNDSDFAGTVSAQIGTKLDSSEVVNTATANKVLRLNNNAQLPASITGNSATSNKLATARTIALSDGATGTATAFDGSGNITIPVTSLDPSKLSSVVAVNKGGTGQATLTAGAALIGNGTGAVTFKNIDTTAGGTQNSVGLITSGAVYGGMSKRTTRVDLRGQLQLTSYRRSVVALCEVTNTNDWLISYSIGTLTLKRDNGLAGTVNLDFGIEKMYNSEYVNYHGIYRGPTGVDAIRPCTFTYNGVKYGGVEIFIANSEYQYVEFNGATNFKIFGLDYLNSKDNTALNAEVNGSISFTNVNLNDKFLFNNKPIATEEYVTTAVSTKADIASPTFTGTPTAPTAPAGNNTTRIATTAFATGADNTLKKFFTDRGFGENVTDKGTTDLNNIKENGNYYVSGTTNGPVSTSGYLTVQKFSDNYLKQTFSVYSSGITFIRVLNNDSWSSWAQLANTSLIDSKAPLASPALTGTPTAPTAAAGTNSTQLATTAFVTTAVANKTSVTGNAGTATKLATARTISLAGDASGSATFDGSSNISITTTVSGLNNKVNKTGDTMTGALTVPSIKLGKFELTYNATDDSLDFIYNG